MLVKRIRQYSGLGLAGLQLYGRGAVPVEGHIAECESRQSDLVIDIPGSIPLAAQIQLYHEGKLHISIGRPIAHHVFGHSEQRMVLPIHLHVVLRCASVAAQPGRAVIDKAEKAVVIQHASAKGLALNAVILEPALAVRHVHADFRSAVQIMCGDNRCISVIRLLIACSELYVAGRAVQGVARNRAQAACVGVATLAEAGPRVVAGKEDAAALRSGAVAGDGTASHIELSAVFDPDSAAVLSRTAGNLAALHVERTVA